MENNELIRLMVLSINQNQKMFDELIKVLNVDIKDEKHKLLRVYSEQNKGLLDKINELNK